MVTNMEKFEVESNFFEISEEEKVLNMKELVLAIFIRALKDYALYDVRNCGPLDLLQEQARRWFLSCESTIDEYEVFSFYDCFLFLELYGSKNLSFKLLQDKILNSDRNSIINYIKTLTSLQLKYANSIKNIKEVEKNE